jgi:uncharacterized coiled-coil protein SlyX
MATVTVRSRFGFTICLAALAWVGSTSAVSAQPAPRRPAAKQPAPEPQQQLPPGPDPETRARLDEQAAALTDASKRLAEQQQLIDGMSAALADARREQAQLAASQQAMQAAIDAERKARQDAEAAAKAAPPVPTVRSAWPTLTLSGLVQVDAAVRQSSEDELRQSGDLLN